MNKDDMTTVVGKGAFRQITVKRIVNAPIERVWRAMTDSSEIGHWWAPGEIEVREGGSIRLHEEGEDSGGSCDPEALELNGTVKVCIPPHIFEFTWHDDYPEAGLVRFDLVDLGGDTTQVTLVQNIPYKDANPATAGWQELVERLCAYSANTVELQP